MNYLDFFKVRNDVRLIRTEIEAFVLDTTIILPPYFKTFIENYEIKSEVEESTTVFLPQYNSKRCVTTSYYSKDRDNILFYNFFELNEIIPNMKAVYAEDHEIWKQDFIAFGECAFQIYLLVGVGEHNKDQIYAEAATEKVKLRFLCDNIFDFFRDYIVELDESRLPECKTVNDLYKNWGEDFWRVREE